MHNDIASGELLRLEAQAAIAHLLRGQHPLLVAYSGGKDSTVLLALTLNAAKDQAARGEPVPCIIVTHGDTGVEHPMLHQLALREMAKARDFGRRHGFQVVAQAAHPALNDTWAVAILSGRKLPTFTNSSSRDCTIAWKRNPMVKLRKHLLARHGRPDSQCPVTLIGTRYEESDSRSVRMTERGETAAVPWEQAGALYLSPLAHWTMEDIWAYLGELRAGRQSAYTDGEAVFALYADAGGTSCAVVSDLATEARKKSRACGARFGCALCTAVGRDKSLETMLETSPAYAWMRPLNLLQRFLVNTQYDWRRRNWLGRKLDAEGFLKIYPTTYAPAMLQELLHYALTIDSMEEDAARKAGLPGPRFQLVTPAQLIAIDAYWSLHALAERPFTAIAIWRDVHRRGNRRLPPQGPAYAFRKFPPPKWLYVGPDWEGGQPSQLGGMRDVLLEHASFDGDQTGHQDEPDGRRLLGVQASEMFEVDEANAELFLACEAERVLADYHDTRTPLNGARAFYYYVELGVLRTFRRHQLALDKLMRRATWKRNSGLAGHVPYESLLASSINSEGRQAALLARAASSSSEAQPARSLRERLCEPFYL